jgi:predicted kinase
VATLHFIYGLPGAGKTGLGRALAAQLPGLFLCEDEWLLSLGGTITTVAEYRAASQRVRALMGPLVTRTLELGTSVVLDFAANTVRDRAWVRAIFEAARADHVLHVLDVPVEECRRRLHQRNAEQPPGLYFGHVADELFDAIVPHIVPPAPEEGFRVEHRA